MFTLDLLNVGESARIVKLNIVGDVRRRMQELGFIPESTVKTVLKSPFGGTAAYLVRGTVIALRCEDAAGIICERSQVT